MPGSNVFNGDTFCVSGAFTISQNEMKELIIKNGGHIAATASRACAYVVSDQIGSSKTQKAVKDGIPVVNEAWVHASVKTGKKSSVQAHFLSGGPSGSGASPSSAAAPKANAAKKGTKRAKDENEDGGDGSDEEEESKPRKAAKTSAKATPASSAKSAKATKAKSVPAASGKKNAKSSGSGSVFAGLSFCVSGAFSISQGDMKKLIESNGGRIAATPNKNCNYVVSDQIGSAKTMKAISAGIPVVTEKWVQDSVSSGNVIESGKGYFLKEDGEDEEDGGGEDEDEGEGQSSEEQQEKLTSAIEELGSDESATTRKLCELLRDAQVVEGSSTSSTSTMVVSLPHATKGSKKTTQLRIVWTHDPKACANTLTITDSSNGNGKVLFAGSASERNVWRGESAYFYTISQRTNELTKWLTSQGVSDCEQPTEPAWSACPPWEVKNPEFSDGQHSRIFRCP